ncbi:alpha/beta hydrolase [Blattabacterium cuenoti]|uniref:alpha/beta hydrolase n=1 Tax=Blattabacterium cuenoti TaxID=1653831 RepID=UPI001CC220C8|nr:phospholipase [Blattabacterium cuenoti]
MENFKSSPIFLMIHGYGSNEKDLFFLLEKDLPKNFFVISLQGIYTKEFDKYYWYDIDFSYGKKIFDVVQMKNTIKKISNFLDKVTKKYQCNNVWLCGFSQGAILSYAIALSHPQRIRKVIALSGNIETGVLHSNDRNQHDYQYSRIEFFISHGKYDTIIPLNLARDSIEFLKEKKISKSSLYYKEYESGHTLDDLNYKDLINWIKKKCI